ncbi:hypothetical protein KP509_14G079300 [Ceratopteris richardii]|nr:hypothetical protein KP509_14G079300 [Ceratopteris richardii]
MCSPGRPNTMFTIGPYAHETQLVSPPVFSTFTTEPSTAPFTPPPELAHLTTPSSPDVPFAQYIRSSLEAKRAAREMVSPLSSSTLASPCDTPASYTPTSGHYYLGSPLGKLISPAWGSCSGELISHGKHPLHPKFFVGQAVSSFPTYDPFASASLDGIPHAAFIFPIDTNGKLEETLTSCSGHCDVAFDCGDCPLQEEVVETFACKHGGNSCHNEVSDTIIPADAAISVTTGVGEKSVELQQHESTWRVHFHLPDAHGSLPIEEAHANDGSCAELSSNVISKRGEKLQELLAHDSTEVPGSQCETQQHGTITRGQEHSKICAMDLSQLTDGEYALENEAGRIEAVQNHADPSHMSAIRPVVLELDEASRAIST